MTTDRERLLVGGARVAAAATVASSALLLGRMRQELQACGRLSAPTVSWMYVTYVGHAAATLAFLRRSPTPRSSRSRIVTIVGHFVASAGAGVCAAGMGRFTGAAHVSGVKTDRLVQGGVYRWTRNPQYLGYVAVLAGLASARRSAPAAVLAVGAAGVFAWWVPVEERHLTVVFGDPYQQYLARTNRWLGCATKSELGPSHRTRRPRWTRSAREDHPRASPHPPTFRRRAVELARLGEQPVAQIAKELRISESCLRNWMAQADADEASTPSQDA